MNRRFVPGPRWIALMAMVLAILIAAVAFTAWIRVWREYPQDKWITEGNKDTRFKYLSIGTERDAGIPYWIFYVMPTMFPENLNTGYASFGMPWEEGRELPIGLTKTVIGYPRVGMNCAFCHTAEQRKSEDAVPVFTPTVPGRTKNAEALYKFLVESARDPRFNSDNILAEIGNWTKLDWIDCILYRFFIIPDTKKRLLERGWQFSGTGHAGDEFGAKLRDEEKRTLVEYMKSF